MSHFLLPFEILNDFSQLLFFLILARKSAVFTKRNSNESILGSSNNNNDKENNKPSSHPPPPSSQAVFKSKFSVEKDQINPTTTTTETKNSSKQVIEPSPQLPLPPAEIKTTAILAPPVGSAPIPVPKPVVVSPTRFQPSIRQLEQPLANAAEVIKPQEAVKTAVKAASPVLTANSFSTPGGWNSAIVKSPPSQLQTTEKSKTELTLEDRVSIPIYIRIFISKGQVNYFNF